MRILLSAFACVPGGGSEEGVGWAWATGLAEHHDVVVLTDGSFREPIERELARRPRLRLAFRFIGNGPPGYEGLEIYPYYRRWQREALEVARELHAARPFDLAHHVTYAMHRVASQLWRLPVPFVWGPVGGGEDVPLRFILPRWVGGTRSSAMELVRWVWNRWCHVSPSLRACARASARAVAATEQTLASWPSDVRRRGLVLTNAVLDRDELEWLTRHRARPAAGRGGSVAFVGRQLGWKGPVLAVHAFRRHAAGHPDATFHLYGDGPLRARLEELAVACGIADRTTFHGRVDRAQLLESFGSHQAMLFPSMHDSGGLAAVEAMAAGVPVVCLDVGGVGEAVPEAAGVKVAPTTPRRAIADLAAGLDLLADDPELWRRASDAATAAALGTPTIEERMHLLYAGIET